MANKGNIPWNKGKTGIYTEKTRFKMGSSMRGKTHTDKWKKERSVFCKLNNIKPIITKETKLKMSIAKKGKKLSEAHKLKIGLSQKGKPHTKEHNKNVSISKRGVPLGEKNYLWQGGTFNDPYPISWTETLRRSIRERDKYTCKICGEPQGDKAHHVHHIDYNKENCDPNNLITLCCNCHLKTNGNRKYWINYFNK